MKISFKEVLSEKDWIHKELICSLTGDLVHNAVDKEEYDVKILVDGVELEPKFLNDLMGQIDVYVKQEAEKYVADTLYKAELKGQRLERLLEEVVDKIKSEFEIDEDY